MTTIYVLGAFTCLILVVQALVADVVAHRFDAKPPISEADEGHYGAVGDSGTTAGMPEDQQDLEYRAMTASQARPQERVI